jgi:hypothetical protein
MAAVIFGILTLAAVLTMLIFLYNIPEDKAD